MIAQEIWNTYRMKFKLDDIIKNMILVMKSEYSNVMADWMQSSGLLGMEMLLTKAYDEQQYNLCEFLLENGAELNTRPFIPNPKLTELNNLLSKYKIHDKSKQDFQKDLIDFITDISQMPYTRENVHTLDNLRRHVGFF